MSSFVYCVRNIRNYKHVDIHTLKTQFQVNIDEAKDEAKAFIKSEYARYGQAASDEDLEKISNDIMFEDFNP